MRLPLTMNGGTTEFGHQWRTCKLFADNIVSGKKNNLKVLFHSVLAESVSLPSIIFNSEVFKVIPWDLPRMPQSIGMERISPRQGIYFRRQQISPCGPEVDCPNGMWVAWRRLTTTQGLGGLDSGRMKIFHASLNVYK